MVKIGVVGNNVDAEFYEALFEQVENVQLAGIFDITKNQIEFADFLVSCQGIYITNKLLTPYDYIVKAFRQGKHVFIKHIAALSLEEISLLLENRKEANVKCMIACDKFCHATALGLFEKINTPFLFESIYNSFEQDKSIIELLIDELSVCMSLVQSDIKKINSVVAAVMKKETDYVNTRLEFSDGLIANIIIDTSSNTTSKKISLIAQQCRVEFNFENNYQSVIVPTSFGILDETIRQIESIQNEAKQLQNFGESILGNATPFMKLREGYKILEIALKILKK